MAGTGLISVIIPVFNVEPYLVKALESVTCQTYRDLEIIIIDDGSTDGSGLICDDFANRDERIKVIHQENRGLSNARNAGLEIMKGEAVAFLDPDDSYHPDYIKAMAEAMDRTGAGIIVCRYKVHHEDGPKLHINKDTVWPSAESGLYGRIEALRALADGAINVSVWNKLYGSDLWKEILLALRDTHTHGGQQKDSRTLDELLIGDTEVLKSKIQDYLRENPSTLCIVTGGQGATEPVSEGEGMRDYLLSQGIAGSRILVEDKALNTVQNINLSKRLMSSPDAPAALVTNNFHVSRALALARKQGLTDVYAIAAPSDPLFLPNNMFREFFGFTKDFLQGNL